MNCRLFFDPPASPSWNMAVDETLLESAANGGEFSLRFYRWQQPTLSLGYFQRYEDRWQHAASRNCTTVRRATGGGAILHDREITYSIAVPPAHRLAVKHLALYETIHTALIEILTGYGIHARLCRCDKGGSPIFANAKIGTVPQEIDRQSERSQPFLCFQRRSPGDVLLSDAKIAGSAQRRCRGAVLQHGSVLLARSTTAPELPGLAELAAILLSFDQLAQAWSNELAEIFSLHYQPGILTDAEQCRAVNLVGEKYDSNQWTQHRGRGIFKGKSGYITATPPL
jgi:lipoate-protein ligase A